MKKLFLILLVFIVLIETIQAQNVDNALLFSQQNYGSTARSKAMGNAFGALGGDFGSLSINPAGIGIYLSGELSSTMSLLNFNSTESLYQGNSSTKENNQFNLRNLGCVYVLPSNKEFSNLVSWNIGIGYNRLANFNQNSYVSTESSPYSRMDAFAQNTNGINYNNLMTAQEYNPYTSGVPWESIMSWQNYLIDVTNPDTGGDRYTTFLLENEHVKQFETASIEGHVNEYLACFGMNYNHRLYLGATLGVQNLLYDESKMYTETGIDEVGNNLKSWGKFDYSSDSKTSGYGCNFKFGAIYRPVPALKIGMAFHTPTWFKIKRVYSAVMSSSLTGVSSVSDGNHLEETPNDNYKYNFHSPLRAIASIAYQIAKKGMVSMDYEFVDYSSSRYSHGLGGDTFDIENEAIKSVYKAVSNIRVGGEYKVTSAVSLRGGLEFFGNPYTSDAYGIAQTNKDYKFRIYNGGIGYRSGKFSLDLTYGLGDKTNFLYLYLIDGVEVDSVKYHTYTHEILFTFCMRL